MLAEDRLHVSERISERPFVLNHNIAKTILQPKARHIAH